VFPVRNCSNDIYENRMQAALEKETGFLPILNFGIEAERVVGVKWIAWLQQAAALPRL
jgi:hypothetical protein